MCSAFRFHLPTTVHSCHGNKSEITVAKDQIMAHFSYTLASAITGLQYCASYTIRLMRNSVPDSPVSRFVVPRSICICPRLYTIAMATARSTGTRKPAPSATLLHKHSMVVVGAASRERGGVTNCEQQLLSRRRGAGKAPGP